ncbi:uncharacterized protein LOC141823813 [Curcuma longa]|uniref:uncharacterized protein LOC141823813 n=1 Tax=Curcuma longa TaxID=136217 RepID=UPI003D9ECCEC
MVLELSNEVSAGVCDTKRTKWSMDEEIHLAKSWINISTDPIVDNDQKEFHTCPIGQKAVKRNGKSKVKDIDDVEFDTR